MFAISWVVNSVFQAVLVDLLVSCIVSELHQQHSYDNIYNRMICLLILCHRAANFHQIYLINEILALLLVVISRCF